MRKRWLAGPAVGPVIGLLVLGIGGRVAMRGVALLGGVPGASTVEGAITVLLTGVPGRRPARQVRVRLRLFATFG